MSLRWMTPSACGRAVSATASGVPPSVAMPSTIASELRGHGAALLRDPAADRVGGALADAAPVEVDAAHARLRGERHQLGARGGRGAREPVALLGEHDDRATLGRLVGQARELRGVGQLVAPSRRAAG